MNGAADSEMEPHGRRSVSPLRTQRRNQTFRLRKTTRRSRVHVQTFGLNVETPRIGIESKGGFSLDIPSYRTCPIWRAGSQAQEADTFLVLREILVARRDDHG